VRALSVLSEMVMQTC